MMAPESSHVAARPAGPASAQGLLAMRVDFAHALGSHLLVFGWIAGLSEWVASAVLLVGDGEYDILKDAARVPRPDVTQNFRDQGLRGDEHGFLALVEAPELPARLQTLRLQVYLSSGRNGESTWPILRDATVAGATLRAHEGTLRRLIPALSVRQRRVLSEFAATPRLSLRAEDLKEPDQDVAFTLPLHIQLCCVLPGPILVVGGVLPRPLMEATGLSLTWDTLELDLLDGVIRVSDLGADPLRDGDDALAYLPGSFLFAAALPQEAPAGAGEARVQFSCAQGTVSARPQPRRDPAEAQAQFAAHLASIDPNARLQLCERILSELRRCGVERPAAARSVGALRHLIDRQMASAIKELPEHLDARGARYVVKLFFDRSIRVANAGTFVTGWFFADELAKARVGFHTPSGEFDVSAAWVRFPRPDVDRHLGESGLSATEDQGYVCFIPHEDLSMPGYLSVRLDSGPSFRIRVPVAPATEAPVQAIRQILEVIEPEQMDLQRLLDLHLSPAIGALWAARAPARHRALVATYGPPCAAPAVSVVVPLYGRHDFADYQLALWADDPDFRDVDLIYVVDDPSILPEFRRLCHDLYGMHRVPFTLAYPGDNLGFAGATNHGAALARAPLLLLLNSDVMPRSPGWLSRMAATLKSHPDTGLLGAKLLYEDGTIQHAGMQSVRYEPWCRMWINDHPLKGMNPAQLTGTREAECVTAACALIETALYRQLGGLSEDYVIGDFEDSDLCHRARAAGRVNRVALDVCLYHLERQSQALGGDARWRAGVTLYNCWLHNRRWAAAIEAARR
jgi:GT2 family glycosyltransferase